MVFHTEHIAEGVTCILGDCREVLPTLGKVDVVITDPPYGVNLGNHGGAKEQRSGLLVKKYGYADSIINFDEVVVTAINECLVKCTRMVVFGALPNLWKLPPPDVLGGVFVPAAVGRNKWGWSNLAHFLLYGKAPALNEGAKNTAFVSSDTAPDTGHPVTKPTQWMIRIVDLASVQSEIVLDPFMGSGTTGVAAVKLDRNFIGIEIEEKYFEIACKRIRAALSEPDLFRAPRKRMPKPDLFRSREVKEIG